MATKNPTSPKDPSGSKDNGTTSPTEATLLAYAASLKAAVESAPPSLKPAAEQYAEIARVTAQQISRSTEAGTASELFAIRPMSGSTFRVSTLGATPVTGVPVRAAPPIFSTFSYFPQEHEVFVAGKGDFSNLYLLRGLAEHSKALPLLVSKLVSEVLARALAELINKGNSRLTTGTKRIFYSEIVDVLDRSLPEINSKDAAHRAVGAFMREYITAILVKLGVVVRFRGIRETRPPTPLIPTYESIVSELVTRRLWTEISAHQLKAFSGVNLTQAAIVEYIMTEQITLRQRLAPLQIERPAIQDALLLARDALIDDDQTAREFDELVGGGAPDTPEGQAAANGYFRTLSHAPAVQFIKDDLTVALALLRPDVATYQYAFRDHDTLQRGLNLVVQNLGASRMIRVPLASVATMVGHVRELAAPTVAGYVMAYLNVSSKDALRVAYHFQDGPSKMWAAVEAPVHQEHLRRNRDLVANLADPVTQRDHLITLIKDLGLVGSEPLSVAFRLPHEFAAAYALSQGARARLLVSQGPSKERLVELAFEVNADPKVKPYDGEPARLNGQIITANPLEVLYHLPEHTASQSLELKGQPPPSALDLLTQPDGALTRTISAEAYKLPAESRLSKSLPGGVVALDMKDLYGEDFTGTATYQPPVDSLLVNDFLLTTAELTLRVITQAHAFPEGERAQGHFYARRLALRLFSLLMHARDSMEARSLTARVLNRALITLRTTEPHFGLARAELEKHRTSLVLAVQSVEFALRRHMRVPDEATSALFNVIGDSGILDDLFFTTPGDTKNV